MPVPWLCLPMAGLMAGLATPQGTVSIQQRIDPDLVVRAASGTFDPTTKVFIYTQGVSATYDLTTVESDRLEIHMAEGEKWAKATGHVHVIDPDAHIDADDLEFTWQPQRRSAKAKNVSIAVGRARIKAQSATLSPNLWSFENVEATNCPEYFWIHSPHVEVVPGRGGKLEHPTLYLFGKRLVTLPNRSFNLDPRTQGVGLPAISYRSGEGLGVSWEAGWLLNNSTNLFVSGGAFPRSYPNLGVIATHSFVPAERASSILTPENELSERFRFGYFENVEVRKPSDETRFLRNERNSISIGSIWNSGVSGRDYETTVSKAVEGVYERGGVLGGTLKTVTDENGNRHQDLVGGSGYVIQARAQDVRERGGPFQARAIVSGSIQAPSLNFSPTISTLGRIDASEFLGSGSYGWTRASIGLIFEPSNQFRLSAAAYHAAEHGTPQFRFDKLVGMSGYDVRADVDLGATRVSFMQKYDHELGWFDREYSITQAAGCLEPYLIYRKFPQTYTLGVRFRMDDLYDIISRRSFRRSGNKTTVISGH